ncbi:5'-nucleotidase C-terminal domain-containing protein [Gramella sp. AN32]|uniref:5'-nucleotidase C-terminal domain-containing protein n=1 Tax=Christiangramia antarctica TaxID=2058158 RepID=A0ABW5X3R0_9FLAO|nr:5'-nucleotidase C-terminal domain-containing protein [Gramella sp. AN32]MCM4157886.1 hypothetical protein [Gramella sp. AN32]
MTYYRIIFCFLLFLGTVSCKQTKLANLSSKTERIAIDASLEEDTEIKAFIEPYKNHLDAMLDSVVAYNPSTLDKNDGDLNTALGNLMADAVLELANPVFKSRTGENIDFVLLNHGGIRSQLPKGNISARSAYNLMPFENEVVVVELTGKKVRAMIQYLGKAKRAHPVSGINLKADSKFKIYSATVAGKSIDENRNYFVATSDYLQQGGDNMNFFSNPVNSYQIDYKIRKVLIDYFNKIDTIKAKIDNRYTKD